MPLSKEEIRVLVTLDASIIPDKKERLRKELYQLLDISLRINEASRQLSFIDMDSRLSGLLKVKLDKLADLHLHKALERYLQLITEEEK